ncbi:MAG: LptF/LptG family permease [Endomicrobium sp.]|jgi:lipopolysaccharide export system permease protein|nr:LptF/LptG family permease [Endomicrobium sp.]
MLKKLHLYIIKEFLGYFFFGLAVFSVFFVLNNLFNLIDLFLSRGVHAFLILKLLVLIVPEILMSTVPMAILLGILISYGRLSEDNEIIAMKSSGVNYKTLTMPIIVPVCIIFIFLLFCNHFIAPSATSNFRNLYKEIIIKRPFSKLAEKTINKMGEYNLCANKINHKDNTLSGVSVYKFDNRKPSTKTYRMYASSAIVKPYPNAIRITLYNGYLSHAHPSDMNSMTHITFKSYCFFVKLYNETKDDNLLIRGMSSPEILKTIKICKELYMPYNKYEIELWIRWTFAFASIAFALVALPVGIMTGRGGRGMGFGISLGIILIYYLLTISVIDLSKKRCVSTSFIMCLPDVVVTILGIYLLMKMRKE